MFKLVADFDAEVLEQELVHRIQNRFELLLEHLSLHGQLVLLGFRLLLDFVVELLYDVGDFEVLHDVLEVLYFFLLKFDFVIQLHLVLLPFFGAIRLFLQD